LQFSDTSTIVPVCGIARDVRFRWKGVSQRHKQWCALFVV